MNKTKKLLLAGVILIAAAMCAGMLVRFHTGNAEQKKRMIYIPKVIDNENDFWTSVIDGARMAAEEYGVELEIMAADSETDFVQQNELIREAIRKQPDALLVSPSSYTAATDLLRQAADQGVRLVLLDSYVDEEVQELLVATDNKEAGETLGNYMRTLIDGNTEIAIVGYVQGVSTAVEREEGVRNGLGFAAGQIVDTVFCDSEYDKAYDLTCELVSKHPDLGVIAGLNEYSATGVARAIRDLGLEDRIKVVGIDSSLESIQFLEAGIMQGLVVQKPFNMGYLGVEKAVQLLEGIQVERNIDSGSRLITRENMYTDENQKLLFPFKDEKNMENWRVQ
jgi:ribose transport system substrate-binding protein